MSQAWYLKPSRQVKQTDIDAALAHQILLTKPAGSLGMLEEIAVSYCAWQQTNQPSCERIQIAVFAADHGVCAQGISAFPQQVTAQMVDNFLKGGAAIAVLAKQLNANFGVINLGLVSPIENHAGLTNTPLMPGTKDFTEQPAMSQKTMLQALEIGRCTVDENSQLFIGGDMGIGNTTSASAIYSVLLQKAPEQTVGPGTGVDEKGLSTKRKVIYQALNKHGAHLNEPIEILQRLGGLEIAGLVGAYIACAQAGIPVLVDGFITTAAALLSWTYQCASVKAVAPR